jgi:hypothetical protein
MNVTINTQNNSMNRKRRRTEDEDEDELEQGSSNLNVIASEPQAIVRDAIYYKDGGDCVLQVENTLFKVHKAFLSQDSSAFVGMFSLPSSSTDDAQVEGTSDENPILLYGDTVEQFRALLFLLYALPHQTEALVVDKVSRLQELIAIAEITHKYHFADLSAWCMGTLKAVFSHTTVAPVHLERMLRVAILSNEGTLRATMVSTLSTKLLDGSLPPTDILIIADRHNIHELQGVAYYAQLMALEKTCNDNELTFPPGVSLNRDQRIRLLAGYWSLVRAWERLRVSPFQDSSPCTLHGSSCTYSLELWSDLMSRSAMAQFSLADVLGKLKALQSMLQNETKTRAIQRTVVPSPPRNPGHAIQSFYSFHHAATHLSYQAPPTVPPGPPPPVFPPFPHYHPPPPISPPISSCQAAVSYAAQKIPIDIQASLQDYFSDRILGLDES